ncbi:hypothetical protein ACLSY1_10745, partial [Avibacterium avium]
MEALTIPPKATFSVNEAIKFLKDATSITFSLNDFIEMTREGQPLLHIDTANFSTIEQARFRKNLGAGGVVLNKSEETNGITDIHSISIVHRFFTFKNKLAKDNEIRKIND